MRESKPCGLSGQLFFAIEAGPPRGRGRDRPGVGASGTHHTILTFSILLSSQSFTRVGLHHRPDLGII